MVPTSTAGGLVLRRKWRREFSRRLERRDLTMRRRSRIFDLGIYPYKSTKSYI